MTAQTQDQKTQSILAWKNTAHITKTTMEFGFAIAAVLIAGTAIYTAAKGVALSSALPAFLANPEVIAAIASYVAIYFVARFISSYQQLYSMEGAKGQDGKDSKNGEDANFSVLLGDAVKDTKIKDAKIVEKDVTDGEEKAKKQLYLELSSENRRELIGERTEGILHVIFKGKDGQYVSQQFKFVTSDKNKDISVYGLDFSNMRKVLGADEKATSLKVAVSDKDSKALKDDVSAKLVGVAIEGAIKKAIA